MSNSHFSGLLVAAGLAVMSGGWQAHVRQPVPGGTILYVGNSSAQRSGPGTAHDAAFTSLFGASGALARIAALAPGAHEPTTIYVMPGHSENVSAADIASHIGSETDVTIIGLGSGTNRPKFNWTAAAGTWLLDTDGIQIANCQLFMAGPTTSTTAITVAAAMTVSGNYCSLVNNYIHIGVDADQIITLGVVVTGDDFEFLYNTVEGAVAAEITATGTFMRLTGADRAHIAYNYIAGALATDTDGLIETLTTASTLLSIHDNFIYARGAGNTCAIDFGANLACSGLLQRNLCVVDADGTAETVVFTRHATNNMALLDNFLVNDNNERGLVIGTASV